MIPSYLKSVKEAKFAEGSFESLCEQVPLCEFLCRGCHVYLYSGLGPYMLFMRYVELCKYRGAIRRKEHVYTLNESTARSYFHTIVSDYVR